LLVGGFGLCGNPEALIAEVARKGVKNLTVVSNDAGMGNDGLGILVKNKQIGHMIASYVGECKEMQRQYMKGEVELELMP
jgi:3-oxoacid CoA-transferase subunit A